MLLTPSGRPAGKIDRIMLLAMWATHLKKQGSKIIMAGIGRPTFPINEYAAKFAMAYWSLLWSKSQEARHLLWGNNSKDFKNTEAQQDKITNLDAVVNYGDPQGDSEARVKMATALTHWYNKKVTSEKQKVQIGPEDILFTIGGAGGLHVIFSVLNRKHPNGIIITPFPHYSLYTGPQGTNKLHPINVMQEPGYCLNADIFAKSLEEADKKAKDNNGCVSAFLFCDPNNPLGTTIDEKELFKIAKILKERPEIYIIIDGAYEELRFDDQTGTSLLSIAPELKKQIILLRSATKALSAAGERMGIIAAFDNDLMNELLQENIEFCGHAPRSQQLAFAEAMEKLDDIELKLLKNYYKPRVEYVASRLQDMGAAMPDRCYKVSGAFYIIADLSDFLGLELPLETKAALNKTGKITTDEDIAYYLLFKGIMIAPLSYFGIPAKEGWLRITCSASYEDLKKLMDTLGNLLENARTLKNSKHLLDNPAPSPITARL